MILHQKQSFAKAPLLLMRIPRLVPVDQMMAIHTLPLQGLAQHPNKGFTSDCTRFILCPMRTLRASGEYERERPLEAGASVSLICRATAPRQSSMLAAELALARAVAMSPSAMKPACSEHSQHITYISLPGETMYAARHI